MPGNASFEKSREELRHRHLRAAPVAPLNR
jgi:hypothetical protein